MLGPKDPNAVPDKRLEPVMRGWAATSPVEAATWMNNADGFYRFKFINRWADDDIDGLGAWLTAHAASPACDRLTASFVRRVATVDPAAAVAWADTIQHPAIQSATYKRDRLPRRDRFHGRAIALGDGFAAEDVASRRSDTPVGSDCDPRQKCRSYGTPGRLTSAPG